MDHLQALSSSPSTTVLLAGTLAVVTVGTGGGGGRGVWPGVVRPGGKAKCCCGVVHVLLLPPEDLLSPFVSGFAWRDSGGATAACPWGEMVADSITSCVDLLACPSCLQAGVCL